MLNSNNSIAWIGTGILGTAIVKVLLSSGLNVMVYNRTMHKANELVKYGATLATNFNDLFNQSKIIFTCLGSSNAFNDLILSNLEILNPRKESKTIIDISTISPESAIDNANKLQSHRINYIECPVSGGKEGASNKIMTAICSGNSNTFTEIKNILQMFCTHIHYVGEQGTAQKLKIINNLAESINLLCASEVILLGTSLGLDIKSLKAVLTTARGRSTYMDLLLERLTLNNNDIAVSLDIRTKDLELANSLLKKSNLNSTLSSATINTFNKTKEIYGSLEDQSKCYDFIKK